LPFIIVTVKLDGTHFCSYYVFWADRRDIRH